MTQQMQDAAPAGTTLFSPIRLRGLELANRITVSPMCQYSADGEGSATDWHLAHLGQLALSGAGLLITEATAVEPRGRISKYCLGLWSDANEAALARVIGFCRRYGSAGLGIQLAHAGRKGSAHTPWEGGAPLAAGEGAWPTVGPSPLAYDAGWPAPAEATPGDLEAIKAAFVAATGRAARIGFDLIEMHAAHGYLVNQFLSPLSNRRGDRYGGDLEGRMRYPLELFAAIRAAWPAERPLGVRVPGSDWVEGGWTVADCVAFCAALKELGADYVVVTSGGLSPAQKVEIGPGYQVPFAEEVRRQTGLVTMTVGMIREPARAEAVLAEGRADMVALARGFLANPRWPWQAAAELGEPAPACPPQYLRALPTAGLSPRRPRVAAE